MTTTVGAAPAGSERRDLGRCRGRMIVCDTRRPAIALATRLMVDQLRSGRSPELLKTSQQE